MTRDEEPKFWNGWWTLTAIGVALTVLGGVLEIFNGCAK